MPDNDTLADEYRLLLRWYPARWRKTNESTVLGMLLDDADRRGLSAPSSEDRVGLICGGLRERFFSFEPVPAASQTALLLGVAFSFFYCFVTAWSPGAHHAGSLGPFANPSILTGVLLVLGCTLALFNAGRSSRLISWTAFVVNALILAGAMRWHWLGPSVWAGGVFALITLVASIRMRRPRRDG